MKIIKAFLHIFFQIIFIPYVIYLALKEDNLKEVQALSRFLDRFVD